MKKIRLLIGLLCSVLLVNAQSQNFVVSGIVKDAETDELLVFANIIQVGTENGISADIDGKFKLEITNRDYNELEITFIGYEPKRIKLDFKKEFYEILLKQSQFEIGIPIIPGNRIYSMPHDVNGKLLNRSTPTTILSQKDLERNDRFSFSPVLNLAPGVFMQNGTLNTNRISIRGIGARTPFSTSKIRAYLNEIPLTSGDGETTIEDFDLSLFEKVEINKGGGDVQHGASLGGTILMKTYQRYSVKDNFQSQTQFGSFNTISTTNQVTKQHGYGWLNLRHTLLSSDGYRDNNASSRQNFSLLSKFDAFSFADVYLLANYTNAKAEIPSSLDSATFVNSPESAAVNWASVNGNEDYDKGTFGLSFHRDLYGEDINAVWKIDGSIFYNFRNNDEIRPFNTLAESSDMRGFRAKGTYRKSFNDHVLEVVAGTEVFDENYDWQTFVNNSTQLLSDNIENRFYYNAFTQADLKLWNGITINAGLNYNDTNYGLTDLFNPDSTNVSGSYEFEPTFSPRLGFVLEPHFSDKFGEAVIYINAGHGFSPPTVAETLTPDGQVNPNIQPETGWTYEVGSRGFLWELPNTHQVYGIYYDFSIYRMDVENLLITTNLGNGTFFNMNAGNTKHDGFEGLVKISPFAKDNYAAHFTVAYTFSNYTFETFNDGNFDYSGNELTGIPSNTLQTVLDFDYEIKENIQLYGSVQYQFVDAMPINDANTVYSDSYQVTNSKLGLRIGFNSVFLNFYGGLNNIFDERYASMLAVNARSFGGSAPRYFYPGLPRHAFGGLSIKWNFEFSSARFL